MILSRSKISTDPTARLVLQAEELGQQLHVDVRRFAAQNTLHPSRARSHARDDREFWQFRPYQAGDPLRSIDWRKSAASEGILIRERQRHDDVTLSIWLDPSSSMHFAGPGSHQEKFECGLVTLLALVRAFGNLDLRAAVAGLRITARPSLPVIAKTFIDKKSPDLAALGSLRLPRGPMLLISDFWTNFDTTMTMVQNLQARGHAVSLLQIVDDAELGLPYDGLVRFHQNDDDAVISSVADIRNAYQNRIREYMSILQNACRNCGTGFHTHRTSMSLHPTLSQVLNGWTHVGI